MFHFSAGVAVGTISMLPAFVARWRRGEKLARFLGRRILAAYALGAFAVFPGVLDNIGVPLSIIEGWWMNIFLLHPILNMMIPGGRGLLWGEVVVAMCSILMYALLLLGIWRGARGEKQGI